MKLDTTNKIKKINDYKPGDKVQITEGVFSNCVAIFQSLKSDERVIASYKFDGSATVYKN